MLATKFKVGTGEGQVSIPESIRVKLNNTPVSHKEMTDFMELVQDQYPQLPKYRVFFGPERERRWGTCWYGRKEIIINRRSVHVFLHEFAHAVAKHIFKADGHDHIFGRVLDDMIRLWLNVTPTT